MSGGAAGLTALLFVYPLDMSRLRLAADVGTGETREFPSHTDCLKRIYKIDGISGLYRGMSVSVFGIAFYRGLYFGLFDTGKVLLFGDDMKKTNIVSFWSFAQLVTITAGVLSYPIDTMRTRLMMMSGKTGDDKIYNGATDCFKKIWK